MARRQSTDRLLAQAQQAIEQDRPDDARVLLEAAARQDTNDPRPWLLLAGIAPSAREKRAFLAQADRLKAAPPSAAPLRSSPTIASTPVTIAYPAPLGATRGMSPLARTALIVTAITVVALGVYLFSQSPVGEALVQDATGQVDTTNGAAGVIAAAEDLAPTTQAIRPTPTLSVNLAVGQGDAFIPTDVPPIQEPGLMPEKEVASGAQPLATWTVTVEPTPTLAPTATPTATPEPSPTPVPPPPGSPRPYGVGENEKWIDVNLTTQTLNAYEGDTVVLTTLISSGSWQYATVTGEFRTYLKYEVQLMNGYLLGYDYYTPDVPSVMYFHGDFAIHGAYWHNNFGTPVSHGCVNAPLAEAAWLFNWAPVGTFVTVHY